jgi:hypothetical protein
LSLSAREAGFDVLDPRGGHGFDGLDRQRAPGMLEPSQLAYRRVTGIRHPSRMVHHRGATFQL